MGWFNNTIIRRHPLTREFVSIHDIKPAVIVTQILEGIAPIFQENAAMGGGIETTPIYIILDAWVRSAPNEQEKEKRGKEMQAHLRSAHMK